MAKSLLFWTHFGIGLAGMSVGFYLSLPIVITLVVAHRIHVVLFRGCFVSKIQQALGHFPEQVNFLQVVWQKLFGRDIDLSQSRRLDYVISVTPVFIALVKYFIV